VTGDAMHPLAAVESHVTLWLRYFSGICRRCDVFRRRAI